MFFWLILRFCFFFSFRKVGGLIVFRVVFLFLIDLFFAVFFGGIELLKDVGEGVDYFIIGFG